MIYIMIGQLSQVQKNLLKPFIQGKIVHDLGAGDLALSREILALGAEKVIAVDKNILPSSKDPRLEIVTLDFRDFAGCIDVAFVSWPSNWPTDLHWVIHSTKIVIYLGSNMDGNMCGYKKLWGVFAQRDVLAYSLDRQNTLI